MEVFQARILHREKHKSEKGKLYAFYCYILFLILMEFNLVFSDDSASKESTCNARAAGDADLIRGLERSPRGRHGNQLQYSCLENSQGQRSLAGYSPWGHKESDTTEQLNTASPRAQEYLVLPNS